MTLHFTAIHKLKKKKKIMLLSNIMQHKFYNKFIFAKDLFLVEIYIKKWSVAGGLSA